MNDGIALRAMSLAGRELVDGFGAERVVSAFEWAELHFRPVCFEDWELLLQWRNASEVRRYSFNTQEIDPEAHRAWLRKRLADGGGLFFIAESHGTPVGQIRFDRVEDEMLVSLNVAPGMAGRGIGSAMLGQACGKVFALHPEVTVAARVKEDNAASSKLFSKAGFSLEGVQGQGAGQFLNYLLRQRHER
jgi:RimJ/RimL family protein N-acetyltransferase